MADLEEAVRHALDPMTDSGWMLCANCGAVCLEHGEHVCRSGPVDLPGLEGDEKRRARSYAID